MRSLIEKKMQRGQSPAPPIKMTVLQQSLLKAIGSKHQTGQQQSKRVKILLLAHEGKSNSHVKREIGVSLNTVKLWRRRWIDAYESLRKFEGFIDTGQASLWDYRQQLQYFLKDKPRSGSPKKISLSQEQQIIALACEKPSDFEIEMTDWTHEMLAHVAIAKGIVSTISSRQVGRILKK